MANPSSVDWSQFTPIDHPAAVDWSQFKPINDQADQPLPAGQYQMGSDFEEVPHLDANGNPAPVPTNRDVQALQGNQAAMAYAANEAGSSQFGPSIAADYQNAPAQAFDAQFGQGAAQAYSDVNAADAPVQPSAPEYGQGLLGYAINNPLTRGLGQGASEFIGGAANFVGNIGPVPQSTNDFLQRNVVTPAVQRAQELRAPNDARWLAKGVQTGGDIIAQLDMAALTGGRTLGAETATAGDAGLMGATRAALTSPQARIAATLGAAQAGNEAAQLTANGQPVSRSQLLGMASLDTAANLVGLQGKLPYRVAKAAAVSEGANEGNNLLTGQPLGAGAAQATLLGAGLGILPGGHEPTLADANASIGEQVRFDDGMNLFKNSVARQDFDEQMGMVAAQTGGRVPDHIAQQIGQSVANAHGTSLDAILRAPPTPLQAGAVAADAALQEARAAVARTAPPAAEPATPRAAIEPVPEAAPSRVPVAAVEGALRKAGFSEAEIAAAKEQDLPPAPAIKPPTPADIPEFPDLNSAQREVEARARQQVLADPAAALDAYEKLPGTDGGRIISTDEAREIFPDYNTGPEARSANAVAVHEPSSFVAKAAWRQALAKPRSGENAFVLFTGGGTGAGKTSGFNRVDALGGMMDSADIIYDGNLQSESSAVKKINEALKSKRKVRIVYTFRDPVQAFVHGALPRAERASYGRTVPIPAHVSTHTGAAETYLALKKHYANDPRVKVQAVINDYDPRQGISRADLAPDDTVPQQISSMDRGTLTSEVRDALESEYQAGRVSDRVYHGTLGNEAPRHGSQPEGGSGRMGQPEAGHEAALADRSGNDRSRSGSGDGLPVGEGGSPASSGTESTQRQTGDSPEQLTPPEGGVSVSGDAAEPQRGVRNSRESEPESATAPHSADEVRAAAVKGWGSRFIQKLENRGVLHFITSDDAVDLGLGSRDELRGVKGIYHDGQAFVVTDQVHNLEDVPGIVVHEAGLHYGWEQLSTPEDRLILRNRITRALVRGDPDVVKAWQHAEKVGTPASALHEETAAYLVEHAPGNSIAQRVIDTVKRGLNRLGVPMDHLATDADVIRQTARDMLRRAAKGEKPEHVTVDANGADDFRASTVHGAPVFSRYSAVMDRPMDAGEAFQAPQELPPRAPGESKADWHGRILRENRVSMIDGLRNMVGLPVWNHEQKDMQSIGRAGMRAMWAHTQRAADQAAAAFHTAQRVFDKAGKKANLEAIDQWERGRPVTNEAHRVFFRAMQGQFQKRISAIQSIAPGALENVIENYFPHLWEDPTKAAKWYQREAGKRPLEGSKSFLKQRIHETIKDGMAAGLKPVSTNPVDLVLAKMAQMDRFLALHQFRKDLQDRGWLKEMKAGERVPYGYARVDDPAFMKAAGLQGYLAVPEPIARDLNNYLTPSLTSKIPGFRALRRLQNLIMMARLGWSAFHAGFTSLDNMVMHADVGLRYALEGDLKRALITWAKTPVSVVWSPIEGGKLNKQWLGLDQADVHTAALLDALEQGGAHYKMHGSDYNRALSKFIRGFQQGDYATSAKSALGAIGEAGSWIIHHKLVPNQKMAARMLLAKSSLDHYAGQLGKERGDYAGIIAAMHPDALKQIMGDVVQSVDDRLGQMNYDNQFWNKTAREAAQTFIGAVGWQVGTVRTVTGGVRDLERLWNPKQIVSALDKEGRLSEAHMGRVSGRLTYMISLGLIMGGSNAALQYLMTGEGPTDPKDYFFPKTGRKNADGSDERLQLPTYWQDHFKLATHPLQTAEHKIHPIFGMVMEAINNQDYWGVQVHDPHASWNEQAKQIAAFVAKGFLPYAASNQQKIAENEGGIGRKAASFFGVTTAPASVSRSKFQAFVARNGNKGFGHELRTQADAEHSQMVKDLEQEIRNGGKPDLSGLSHRDLMRVRRESREEVPELQFKRMEIEDKLDAWDMATPEERKRYHLREDILHARWKTDRFGRLPQDQQDAIIKRVEEISNNRAD